MGSLAKPFGLTEPTPEEKSEMCRYCGECCRELYLDVVKPKGVEERVVVEWMSARGVKIIRVDEDSWRVKMNIRCPYLDSSDGYRCAIYESRPENCRRFDGRMVKADGLKCAWEKHE